MDCKEFLRYQIDGGGKQLMCALKGFGEAGQSQLYPNGMTVSEMMSHLAEAYQAVVTIAAGGQHDWGSFKLRATDFEGSLAELKAMREKAVAVVLVDDPVKLKLGADFIVAHDAYHVGQLVPQRIVLDPSWNSYEIYE